eukprot:TRINITY_DN12030_c0_g1_i1.p2 TRINITY_DN12030_c0_g1~~TRINITY_DN12030_c0_g1_i1.p2  ORF type:complete len:159 (+),score=9.27 TRINITY_DN12030_c0_g1_i1:197-673(+)
MTTLVKKRCYARLSWTLASLSLHKRLTMNATRVMKPPSTTRPTTTRRHLRRASLLDQLNQFGRHEVNKQPLAPVDTSTIGTTIRRERGVTTKGTRVLTSAARWTTTAVPSAKAAARPHLRLQAVKRPPVVSRYLLSWSAPGRTSTRRARGRALRQRPH